MKLGDRLIQLRKERNYTREAFAEILGISKYTLRNYELGITEPGHLFLVKVADLFNTTLDYILGLTDERERLVSLSLKSVEYEHIQKYRALDPYGQDIVDTILDKETARIKEYGPLTTPTIVEYQSRPDSKIIVLPYFRAGVSAGSGIFILGNEAEDEIELPNLPEYVAADFAIDVNGQSMEPEFSDKDIALVNQDAEMQLGDIGVFVINGNAFIKELGEKELISHNKDFKNIAIHSGDNIVCMGKVIGKVK